MRKYKPRAIAFTSDIHIGSRYAVFPEGFYSPQEGNELSLNAGQEKFLDFWRDYVAKCDEFNVDTVVLPGDIITGTNRREFGRFMMTTNLNEQVDAAAMLLKPLCKGRKTFMFDATGYHESLDSRQHKALSDKLRGRYMGGIANLRFSGKRFNVAHGSSGASIYRETRMGRDALFTKWAEAMGKIPKIDALVKGHWHQFIHIHANKQHILQLPCWQAYIPYQKATGNYAKWQPDVGGVIVLLDEDARIRVWHFLYEPVPSIGVKDVVA